MRTAAGVFLLGLSVLVGAARALPAQEPDARALERARRQLVESGRYETRLPDVRELDDGIDLGALGGILGFLAVTILVITLIIVIGLSARALADRRRRQRAAASAPAEDALLEKVAIEVDLGEIEALARERRYSEAIHLLLLRTIGELVRLARVDIRPAWTSREIAASIPLGPEPREDLRDLVHRAELGHFAEFESSEEDYLEARGVFERLVSRLGGAAA